MQVFQYALKRDVEAEAVDGAQQVKVGETFLVTQSIGPERHYQDDLSPDVGGEPVLGGSTGTAAVPLVYAMHNATGDAAKRANYKKKLGKKEVLSELFAKPHLAGASRFWSEKEVEFTAIPPGPSELKAFGDNLVDIIIISDMNLTLEEKKAKELNGVDVPNVFDEKAFETFTSNPVGAMLNPRSLLDKGFVKSPTATIQKRESAFDRINEITSQMIFRTEIDLIRRQAHYRKLLENLWASSAQEQITKALTGSEDISFQAGLKHVTGNNDKGPAGTLRDIRHTPIGPEQKELQRRLQEGAPLVEQLAAGTISATASAFQSAVDTLMLQGAQEASAQMQAMKHVFNRLSSQFDDVGKLAGGSHYRDPLYQGKGFVEQLGELPDGVSSIRDDNDVTNLTSRKPPGKADKTASDFLARYCYEVLPAAKDPAKPTPDELVPNPEMRAFQRTRVMGAGHGKTAPHLSRHHWGTDFDFNPIASAPYEAPGTEANRFEWMDRFARYFGFFQPYKENPVDRPTQAHAKLPESDSRDKNTKAVIGILEEKWHWSYFPVAEAYREFIKDHAGDFNTFLINRLTKYEKDLYKGLPGIPDLYSWIKDHWFILHNNIQVDFKPNDEIASYLPIK
jgi:hypothetical protein